MKPKRRRAPASAELFGHGDEIALLAEEFIREATSAEHTAEERDDEDDSEDIVERLLHEPASDVELLDEA